MTKQNINKGAGEVNISIKIENIELERKIVNSIEWRSSLGSMLSIQYIDRFKERQ